MADKEIDDIEEPTMEDLEEDLDESEAPQEEEEKEEVETESLEARVETEKKRLLMTMMKQKDHSCLLMLRKKGMLKAQILN